MLLNILEAFSNETLVILNATPGNQTLVEDGITVILFEKANSISLASKIGEVVSDIERFNKLKINAKSIWFRNTIWLIAQIS